MNDTARPTSEYATKWLQEGPKEDRMDNDTVTMEEAQEALAGSLDWRVQKLAKTVIDLTAERDDQRTRAEKAELVAQVTYDLHNALRVRWGDDPYPVIRDLKASAKKLEQAVSDLDKFRKDEPKKLAERKRLFDLCCKVFDASGLDGDQFTLEQGAEKVIERMRKAEQERDQTIADLTAKLERQEHILRICQEAGRNETARADRVELKLRQAREALCEADSELSAYAHGRPLSREVANRVSRKCRTAYEALAATTPKGA